MTHSLRLIYDTHVEIAVKYSYVYASDIKRFKKMKLLLNATINRHYIRDLTMEMIGIPFCSERENYATRTYAYFQRHSFCLSQFRSCKLYLYVDAACTVPLTILLY